MTKVRSSFQGQPPPMPFSINNSFVKWGYLAKTFLAHTYSK